MTDNDYLTEIYKEASILSTALTGAKSLAKTVGGTKMGTKLVTGTKNALTGSIGKKMGTGAVVGGAIGSVKGSNQYDATQDDGSFGKSRIGQTLKGAVGGAAGGAAAGAALHGAVKGGQKLMAKAKTVSTKAPAGTAAATVTPGVAAPATVTPKPTVVGGGEGSAIRNTTNMTLEEQMKKRGIKTTGAKPVINFVPLRSVASDELNNVYMEKVAIEFGERIKNIMARIKKLPAAWVNTSPELRVFIGTVAGAGIAALTLPRIASAEKVLSDLEKKLGGKIPLGKIKGRGANAIIGGSAGAILGYHTGKTREKTASEMLKEILE